MTKLWHGTDGNDVIAGSDTESNIFFDVGTGQDTIIGGQRNDRFMMTVDQLVDHVDGGKGEDTIDYSSSTHQMNINLATGDVTANFGGPDTILPILHNAPNWQEVAEVKNVEDVVGSKFNDTIIGSSADNRLDGGAGDDVIHAGNGNDTLIGGTGHNLLDGGNGSDTADYSASSYSIWADLSYGGAIALATGEPIQDTYVSIENVTGSAQADMLIGSTGANVIDGGAGDDFIFGGGGNDVLHGGAGNDSLFGDSSSFGPGSSIGQTTAMFGDDGNDTLYGGAGKEAMDGGTGNDWIDYSGQHLGGTEQTSDAVIVDLAGGVGYGGFAQGDTYVNIENVRGTDHDDIIFGDGNDNILDGGAGNNVVHGGAGHDTLMGNGQLFDDDGNDTFVSRGIGATSYDGGDGTDTVDYSGSANHAFVDMIPGSTISGVHDANGNQLSHDSYSSIENVEGSQQGDAVFASDSDNVINGHGGDDFIFGFGGNDTLNGGDNDDWIEGGAGADTMDGGTGINTLSYSFSATGVAINLTAGTASGGDAAGDSFTNFQNIMGSHGNDTLIGSGGNNVFLEEAGINQLIGAGGHDTFGFYSDLTGSNTVLDFHVGDDKLAFVGTDTMQDLSFTQTGAGTVIHFDNTSGSVLLLGVNAADLVQHASTELVFTNDSSTLLHG